MRFPYRLALAGVALLLSAGAIAEDTSGARQLTVELFSSRNIQDITITPEGPRARMRACATCPATPVHLPIHLSLHHGKLQSDDGLRPAVFRLVGAFHLQAGNSQDGTTPEEAEASGEWEIRPSEKRLQILLTIPSERYVALALNGEVAGDEPRASLQAMAIVTRTFALENAPRHAAQGFNLCDSTHCQALRFGRIRPAVLQAEKATLGETLWFGAQRAHVFYAQNCGGVTEDAASVWPMRHFPYLVRHADPYCLRRSVAHWHAEIPESRMLAIARNQGWRFPPHIESIRISRRTSSGRASLLEISGGGMHASVSADSLRFAVDRELGWNQMRSDWYTVSLSNGVLHFVGKGYGHGVGLCQAGAYEMAATGQSTAAILSFYFPGTQVRITPQDSGWNTVEGSGWTLLTANASRSLLEAGNTAWREAQSLFPQRAPVHPVVHDMPSTELFRQATSEPGWILSTERGEEIFLQPAAVLQAHAPVPATLRHEFLHVLVENEASAKAPLWLREGMVEALAGEPARSGGAFPFATLKQIDLALTEGANQRASEGAHDVARSIVSRSINRYGLVTVRGWLRNGVPGGIVKDLSQALSPLGRDTTRSTKP